MRVTGTVLTTASYSNVGYMVDLCVITEDHRDSVS